MNRRSFIASIVAGLAALKVWPVKAKAESILPEGAKVLGIYVGGVHRGVITRCDSSDSAYEFNGQDWEAVPIDSMTWTHY